MYFYGYNDMCFRKIVILDYAQLFKKREIFLYPLVKKQDLNELLMVIAAQITSSIAQGCHHGPEARDFLWLS